MTEIFVGARVNFLGKGDITPQSLLKLKFLPQKCHIFSNRRKAVFKIPFTTILASE